MKGSSQFDFGTAHAQYFGPPESQTMMVTVKKRDEFVSPDGYRNILIASLVTVYARKMLVEATIKVVRKGGHLVYGDTDSLPLFYPKAKMVTDPPLDFSTASDKDVLGHWKQELTGLDKDQAARVQAADDFSQTAANQTGPIVALPGQTTKEEQSRRIRPCGSSNQVQLEWCACRGDAHCSRVCVGVIWLGYFC